MTDLVSFIELAKTRRSVRQFLPDAPPRETLLALADAAQWAPSAGNRQDWIFYLIESHDLKNEMAEIVQRRWKSLIDQLGEGGVREQLETYARHFVWFAEAPAVFVVSCKRPETFLSALLGDDAPRVSGSEASAAMAAQNLALAAHAAGLGSCCLTAPVAAESELRKLLNIPRRLKIVCLVAVGYPAKTSGTPPRREIHRIVKEVS